MNELANSILCILNKYGAPIGAGFLVSDDTAITCAHVVSNTGNAANIDAEVGIKFPFLAPKTIYRAQVIFWNKEEDVAGLRLLDGPPPEGKPVSLIAEDCLGHIFKTYGFPNEHSDGIFARGVLIEEIANGWLQMEDTKEQGIRIQRGFSGAPVWDEQMQGVVGMVVAAKDDKSEKMGFCVPSRKLLTIWPQLSAYINIPACPYRELFAFREEDSDLFFGRDAFTKKLLSSVKNKPLVAVLGASGSGKSSVVFAGLIPNLRRDPSWMILSFRPGQRPFDALGASLVPVLEPDLTEAGQMREARIFSEILREQEQSLADAINRIVKKHSACKQVLLYIDQFEELFTSITDYAERTQFINALIRAVNDRKDYLRIVLTLRADFLEHALAYRPLADALQDADLKLGPMNHEELRQVIEKPAKIRKVKFEPGLTDLILEHIKNDPAALPLLEFALTQLWDRQSNRTLTIKAYQEIGGVEKALTQYADSTFAHLKSEDLEKARRVFTQLVRLEAGTIEARRLAMRSEIKEADKSIIEEFINKRLLVTDRTPMGQETVEIVHEALIRGCQTIHGWIEKDREFLAWYAQFRIAMQQWVDHEKKESALLRGLNLSNAEKWLSQRSNDLNRDERLFILLSSELKMQEQAERNRRRRLTLLSIIFSVLTLVSVLLVAYFGIRTQRDIAQNAERVARAGEIAAQSEVLASTNPQVSMLLAMEAMNATSPSLLAAEQALRDGMGMNSGIGLSPHEGPVTTLEFSPDARWLVTGSRRGTTRLWDMTAKIASANSTLLTNHGHAINDIAFSPNHRWLATGLSDNTTLLWDMNSVSADPKTLYGHINQVSVLAFSPDDRWLATGSLDTTILLWDLQAEDVAASSIPLHGSQTAISNLMFSPDGHWLAELDVDSILLWNMVDLSIDPIVLNLENDIIVFAFSPDSRWIATGSKDSIVRLWNLKARAQTPTHTQEFSGHKNGITAVAFSPDSHWLATGGWDSTVRLWDLKAADPQVNSKLLHGNNGPISTLAFSPQGSWLASGGRDATAYLWDVSLFETSTHPSFIPVALHAGGGHIRNLVFSPDDRWLASIGSDNKAKLWNLTNDRPYENPIALHDINRMSFTFSPDGHWLATMSNSFNTTARLRDMTAVDPSASANILSGHTSGITTIATSANADWLATGSYDSTVRLWNMKDFTKRPILLDQHTSSINILAFNEKGNLLATGSSDNSTCVWSIPPTTSSAKPDLLRCLAGHSNGINALDFSADGRWLAEGGDDHIVQLWDLSRLTASSDPKVLRANGLILVVKFSRDGQWLLVGSSDSTAELWNVNDLSKPVRLVGHKAGIATAEFSPDGHWLATGGWDARVRLWDLTTTDPSSNPTLLPVNVTAVSNPSLQISPNGRWLAVGGPAQQIFLWDLTSNQPVSAPTDVLIGHTGYIDVLAFSPDERWLASGSRDNTVRLWSLTTNNRSENSIVLRGHKNLITSLAFSQDSNWLVSGSWDNTARYWSTNIDQVLEMACKLAGRNLSQEEWTQYFPDEPYHQTCPEWPSGNGT
jgi:WD40 repeat protein